MPTVIFAKTSAGHEELINRRMKLSASMRSVLVMVDGKRSLSDYVKVLGSKEKAIELLDILLDLQLIEPIFSETTQRPE